MQRSVMAAFVASWAFVCPAVSDGSWGPAKLRHDFVMCSAFANFLRVTVKDAEGIANVMAANFARVIEEVYAGSGRPKGEHIDDIAAETALMLRSVENDPAWRKRLLNRHFEYCVLHSQVLDGAEHKEP